MRENRIHLFSKRKKEANTAHHTIQLATVEQLAINVMQFL